MIGEKELSQGFKEVFHILVGNGPDPMENAQKMLEDLGLNVPEAIAFAYRLNFTEPSGSKGAHFLTGLTLGLKLAKDGDSQ